MSHVYSFSHICFFFCEKNAFIYLFIRKLQTRIPQLTIHQYTKNKGRHYFCNAIKITVYSVRRTKIFEYCFLQKFGDYLCTDSKQFGFKKGMGCNHAINTVRCVIEQLTKGGNTVNLCAIDLSKAFDKVNHHALLIKLMKRKLPVILLELLEN